MTGSSKKVFPIPLEINWHEGMLLSQHHFQQSDLRQFYVLTHQIKLLSSIHFGVCYLRVDNVALPDGLYRINEIEAVFPDGLIYSYFPDENIKLRPLEINVAQQMKKDETEVTIYLVIAENIDGSSPILSKPARYYSVEGEYIDDDNIPGNSVKIPRLFPNAYLTLNLIPEMCIGFPLCKVTRIDGVYHVKNWTPPCFFIAKHFPMWERCLKLALNLREKATFLSDKLKNSTGIANFTAGTEQILRQILSILPAFEALVYSNNIRPYELYEQLAEILGAVCVLRPTDMIPIMRPYDHNNIDESIYPLMNLIERYISVIDRGFSTIAMHKKERFFYHYIEEKDLKACKKDKLYVGIKGNKRDAYHDVETWMMNAIIVSDSAIEAVREKRVKGAHRAVADENLISEIMPGSGTMLFEVLIDHNFIKGEQNLHIFNPGDTADTRPIEINLYIPRAREE